MKQRYKLLYCKYCFKACSIASAMEQAINLILKKTMTVYVGSRGINPFILNLGTTWS